MKRPITILELLIFLLIVSLQTSYSQWTKTNGPFGGLINTIAGSGSNLIAGTSYVGVYISSNSGANWSNQNNGLNNFWIYKITIIGSSVFAATWDGVFISNDNGNTWTSAGLSGYQVYSLASIGSNIFAGTSNGVFVTTNSGSSWNEISNGLTNKYAFSLTAEGSILYLGGGGSAGGVFMSSNNGTNWTSVSNGLPSVPVRSIVVKETNIFACLTTGVYLSTNNGANWTSIKDIDALTLNKFGSNLFLATSWGVFISSDNGVTWNSVNNGLNGKNSVVFCFGNFGSNLYAGTQIGGVFKSSDNGNNWTAINNGLIAQVVYNIASNGNNIFAATAG